MVQSMEGLAMVFPLFERFPMFVHAFRHSLSSSSFAAIFLNAFVQDNVFMLTKIHPPSFRLVYSL